MLPCELAEHRWGFSLCLHGQPAQSPGTMCTVAGLLARAGQARAPHLSGPPPLSGSDALCGPEGPTLDARDPSPVLPAQKASCWVGRRQMEGRLV